MDTDHSALTGGVGGSSRSEETTSAGASSVSVSGPLVFKGISFAYPTRPDFPVFKVSRKRRRRGSIYTHELKT
jgi:hypothetical protein